MPLSCFAYTLCGLVKGAHVRIAGVSSCLGTHVRITGVSSCLMISASRLEKSGADNQSVQLLEHPCADNQSVQLLEILTLDQQRANACVLRDICSALLPARGADLDFDVCWIRPPVDWGGG